MGVDQLVTGGDVDDPVVDSLEAGRIQNVVQIDSAADLPPVKNGRHQLEDATGYKFNGFVSSQHGLALGTRTPVLGAHGGLDGFICTGGGPAIYGRDAGVFMRNVSVHAPGGTVFDVKGDQTTEMLAESCSYSDATDFGSIATLGSFDGLRVPTFKGCNFGDFDGGLTFTGSPDKVFIEACPLRGVTKSNVTIFTFDSEFTCEIVDMPNNYVKDVQSDTQIIDVDPSATITEVFQYRGNTHDPTVQTSNILNGAAGAQEPGYRVKGSFRLTDSIATVTYSLDATSTTTIASQAADSEDGAAYEKIAGSTTTKLAGRFTTGDNQATYKGKKDTNIELNASLAVGGDAAGNGDIVAVAWFKNDSLVSGTSLRVDSPGRGNAVAVPISVSGIDTSAMTGDTYDLRIANLDSTSNVDVGAMNTLIEGDL